MTQMNRRTFASMALALGCGSAAGQNALSGRAMTMIAPFPPGGITDLVARTLATGLGQELQQTVVVENKAGASGIIGTIAGAKAAPDGFTIMLGNTANIGTNPATFAKLPYDAITDFIPISMTSIQPLAIGVSSAVEARDLKQLIQFAKANPRKLTYGSGASSLRLAVELFCSMNQIKMHRIPYSGSAPSLAAMMGGHVDVSFDPISTLYPSAKAGKIRILAVTTAERSSIAPEFPTVHEAGTPGYNVSSWQALFVPAGTPKPVVQRLNAAVAKILSKPETHEFFQQQGIQPWPTSTEKAVEFIRSEVVRWKTVAQESGVPAE